MQLIAVKSETESKQIQTHFIFKNPLPIKRSKHIYENTIPPDFQALLEQHSVQYSNAINIPGWQEVLWAIDIDLKDLDLTNYTLTHSTSFEAQAIRQGLNTPIKPLGIAGLVKTSDHFYVFGLRTGVAKGGYLCNAPAGHCGPEQGGDNILEAGFIEELETELGVTTDEISNINILGFQSDPDFGRAINVVISAEMNLTFSEIERRHNEGQNAFHAARNSGLSYIETIEKLKADGVINIDSHEHDLLVAIPTDRATLETIIKTKQFSYNVRTKTEDTSFIAPIMDIAKGSLIMQLNQQQP
jgi:hypothetical protein